MPVSFLFIPTSLAAALRRRLRGWFFAQKKEEESRFLLFACTDNLARAGLWFGVILLRCANCPPGMRRYLPPALSYFSVIQLSSSSHSSSDMPETVSVPR